MRVLLIMSLLLMACGTRPRSRCERICGREAECAREADQPHDQGECVAECGKLERDAQLVRFVDQQMLCVDKARSCDDVLRCP